MRGAHYGETQTRVKNEMAFQKLGRCNILPAYSSGVTVSGVAVVGGSGEEVGGSTGSGKME